MKVKFAGLPPQGIELRHFGKRVEDRLVVPDTPSIIVKNGIQEIDEQWIREWRDQNPDHPLTLRGGPTMLPLGEGDMPLDDGRPGSLRQSEQDYGKANYDGGNTAGGMTSDMSGGAPGRLIAGPGGTAGPLGQLQDGPGGVSTGHFTGQSGEEKAAANAEDPGRVVPGPRMDSADKGVVEPPEDGRARDPGSYDKQADLDAAKDINRPTSKVKSTDRAKPVDASGVDEAKKIEDRKAADDKQHKR